MSEDILDTTDEALLNMTLEELLQKHNDILPEFQEGITAAYHDLNENGRKALLKVRIDFMLDAISTTRIQSKNSKFIPLLSHCNNVVPSGMSCVSIGDNIEITGTGPIVKFRVFKRFIACGSYGCTFELDGGDQNAAVKFIQFHDSDDEATQRRIGSAVAEVSIQSYVYALGVSTPEVYDFAVYESAIVEAPTRSVTMPLGMIAMQLGGDMLNVEDHDEVHKIAQAMASMHTSDILHLDLHDGNVILSEDGTSVRIIDWGRAILNPSSKLQTLLRQYKLWGKLSSESGYRSTDFDGHTYENPLLEDILLAESFFVYDTDREIYVPDREVLTAPDIRISENGRALLTLVCTAWPLLDIARLLRNTPRHFRRYNIDIFIDVYSHLETTLFSVESVCRILRTWYTPDNDNPYSGKNLPSMTLMDIWAFHIGLTTEMKYTPVSMEGGAEAQSMLRETKTLPVEEQVRRLGEYISTLWDGGSPDLV